MHILLMHFIIVLTYIFLTRRIRDISKAFHWNMRHVGQIICSSFTRHTRYYVISALFKYRIKAPGVAKKQMGSDWDWHMWRAEAAANKTWYCKGARARAESLKDPLYWKAPELEVGGKVEEILEEKVDASLLIASKHWRKRRKKEGGGNFFPGDDIAL